MLVYVFMKWLFLQSSDIAT